MKFNLLSTIAYVGIVAINTLHANSIQADIISGPIVNPANGHRYYLLDNANWTDSEAEAISLGGHLVTINDAAENQWVFDTFGNFDGVDRNLWIGFNDAATEGTFVWSSGEAPGYTNWNTGEPNNDPDGGANEDYAVIAAPEFSADAVWNDTENSLTGRHAASGVFYPNHGVVELNAIPEPGSGLLLCAGLIATLGYRRIRLRSTN